MPYLNIGWFLVGLLFLSNLASARDAIFIDAKINEQPARMIFDTGAEGSVLLRAAAERLNLRILEFKEGALLGPGASWYRTDLCDIKIEHASAIKGSFGILETPSFVDYQVDGLFGWGDFKEGIFDINAENKSLTVLDTIPAIALAWRKILLHKNTKFLILEYIRQDSKTGTILIDTGAENHVALSPQQWKKWKEEHPNDPSTLIALHMQRTGLSVYEVMWARSLKVGPIELHNVSIRKANESEIDDGGGDAFEMSLSMEALRQMNLIVNRTDEVGYVSEKATQSGKPPQNRSGVIFVPRDLESNELIAHVVPRSPAEEAGIKTGDSLLKINSEDISDWKSGKTIRFSPLAEQPAGNKIALTLKRGDKEFEAIVILRDIFGNN